ncbi:hypothetical protein OIDMADRAFT_18624 [Oidiodendron maius Zn]|uniref:Uncharacterized protein n=1 Tax=Oidiodendron maius (strain Zn) TaxID=913774 RepID=A0A0C3CRT7_OIDMZ|nr:hypothetical protein OIDMADRAFT_18624 [Oidiodendron maius Zn]
MNQLEQDDDQGCCPHVCWVAWRSLIIDRNVISRDVTFSAWAKAILWLSLGGAI